LERFELSQSVLDVAPVSMVITSADDKVVWANLALSDFLGISRAKIVTSSFLPYIHADDRALLTEDADRYDFLDAVTRIEGFWLQVV
jgi:PAS domain-containing protein